MSKKNKFNLAEVLSVSNALAKALEREKIDAGLLKLAGELVDKPDVPLDERFSKKIVTMESLDEKMGHIDSAASFPDTTD